MTQTNWYIDNDVILYGNECTYPGAHRPLKWGQHRVEIILSADPHILHNNRADLNLEGNRAEASTSSTR